MSNPNLKYKVELTPQQRENLSTLTRNGSAPAKKILHARVLLMADQKHPQGPWKDIQIAKALGVHVNTVARIRKNFVWFGWEAALERKQRWEPPVPPKLDGQLQAHLVAICCSEPPQGRVRWTLTLLVEELKMRELVTEISRETVRKALKKNNCNLGKSNATVSQKKLN
jgi:transposase